MREIKFRGQTYDTPPHWVFGDLYHYTTGEPAINYPHPHKKWLESEPVRPATVGQFTGLYDCDGHEIYEGDVLGNKYPSHYKFANAVVEWGVDGWITDCFSLREFLKLHTCIVVGNIYDNSELLPELPEVKDARD